MPNNKSVRQCKWCDEYYCANCSTHSGFEDYCSKECADGERIFNETRATEERIKTEHFQTTYGTKNKKKKLKGDQ